MKSLSSTARRWVILCAASLAVAACAHDHRANDRVLNHSEEDPCNRDHNYCDYPVYEGRISIGGIIYAGRFRYRDTNSGREYRFNKSWQHADPGKDGDVED